MDRQISLDVFTKNDWLSFDAVKVCHINNLLDFKSLISYYKGHGGNFDLLRNCNTLIQYELCSFCKSFDNFSLYEAVNGIEYFLSITEIIQKSDDRIKRLLNRFVKTEILKLSVRARNGFCQFFNGVTEIEIIVSKIFIPHFSFFKIKNIGIKSANELDNFKTNLLNFVLNLNNQENNDTEDELLVFPNVISHDVLQIIEDFSPHKNLALNRHIDYLISKLQVRAKNGILFFWDEHKKKKDLLKKIFSPEFTFKDLKNIGEKSIDELDNFKEQVLDYILKVRNLENEELSKEFSRLIIKTAFSDLSDVKPEVFEEIFDDTGKIKLFKLIQILLDSGYALKINEKEVFWFEFSNRYKNDLVDICNQLNLTKERIRQIKIKLSTSIEAYFGFIINFKLDDLLLYDLVSINHFKILDTHLVEKINSYETVSFSLNFYCKILNILFQDLYSIIGTEDAITDKTKSAKKIHELNNKYIISKALTDEFDFIKFIIDIDSKLSDRISETYELQFEGYLWQFLYKNNTSIIEKAKEICETILFNEFEILIDASGYISFERNTPKQIHEFCFDILDASFEPMTIAEIQNTFSVKYSDIGTTNDSIRGCLNREKELFIYYGRSSTYGLRKWEQEKENHKGGTIRDIVEEYLENEESPKHISEILEHVQKYRDTNERSVLTNIQVEVNNRFTFFNGDFIGVKSKAYSEIDTNYKKILGTHFRRHNLEKMIGWDINRIITYFVENYGYSPIQIKWLIHKKEKENEIKITNENTLLL